MLRRLLWISIVLALGLNSPSGFAQFASTATRSAKARRPNPANPQLTADFLVRPGESAGLLRLGESLARAKQILGRPTDEYAFPVCPGSSEFPRALVYVQWYDHKRDNNGVSAYFSGGRAIQIDAAGPEYSTTDGIRVGATPLRAKESHPSMRAFVLLNSGSAVFGGRDLIYWDDETGGVALELFHDRESSTRLVSKLIVHQKGVAVIPDDCRSARKVIPPFATSP